MFEKEFEEFVKRFKEKWLKGTLPEKFTTGRGDPIPEKLTIRSGNLLRSLQEANFYGGESLTITDTKLKWIKWTSIPYARLHELGGNIKISDKQRYYFFKKFQETGEKIYYNMAISTKEVFNYPARPYFKSSAEVAFNESIKPLAEAIKQKIKMMVYYDSTNNGKSKTWFWED